MDLDEIRSFLAVYEARSFVRASDALGVPRATVRRRVDALEARVGAELFVRTAQGATSTAVADALAPRAREVLHQARAMLRSVRHADGDLRGQLHVGVPPGLPPVLVHTLLAMLRNRAPDVQLVGSVIVSPESALQLDVDLLLFQGAPRLGTGWTVQTPTHVRRRLIASAALLDEMGRPRTVADLDGFSLLVQGDWSSPPTLLPLLDGTSVVVRPALVHPDVHLLHQLAAMGAGMAFVPDAELDPILGGVSAVDVVLEDVVGDVVSVSVATPDALFDVPRVRAVFDLVCEMLGTL